MHIYSGKFYSAGSFLNVTAPINVTNLIIDSKINLIGYESVNYLVKTDNTIIDYPDYTQKNISLNNGSYYFLPNYWDIINYDAGVFETQFVTWGIKFIGAFGNYIDNPVLVYDGISYPTTRQMSGDLVLFYNMFAIPNISVSGIKTFYWNWTINGSTASTPIYSTYVTAISVDNCSSFTNAALNVSVFNEENPSQKLTATMQAVISAYITNPLLSKNFTFTFPENHSFLFCINADNISFHINAYFQYENETMFTHRYYLNNRSVNAITQNISVYNIQNISTIKNLKGVVLDDTTYNYFAGLYVQLQRFYPGSNQWITTQMDRTGNYGELIFHIREQDTEYRLIFQDEKNSILKMTDSVKFLCDPYTLQCEISVYVRPYIETEIRIKPDYNVNYDNETKRLSVTWFDPSYKINYVRMLVTKQTMLNNVVICDTTTYNILGTMECNLQNETGLIQLWVFSSASPERPFINEYFEVPKARLIDMILGGNNEGTILSFIFMLTIIGAGAYSAVTAIIMTILGLILIYLFGLSSLLSYTMIVIAAVLGIWISIKLRS